MNKEELKQEAEDFLKKSLKVDDDEFDFFKNEASCKEEIKRLTDFVEPREKRIAELQEKISVLLSCKNCPENKGGWICVKEYENKCLTQKIVYIKELKEENAELEKEKCELLGIIQGKDKVIQELKEENAELKDKLEILISVGNTCANYKHCAEIEEPKTRRMTYKELSRWLREKPTREYKYLTSDFICCDYDYREENQDKEAHEDILIREDDGEWREPLVEVEE